MQIRTKIIIYFVLTTASLLLLAFILIYTIASNNRETIFRKYLKNKALTNVNLFVRLNEIDTNLLKIIDYNRKDRFDFEKISIYDLNHKNLYTSNRKIRFRKMIRKDEVMDQIIKEGEVNLDIGSFKFIGFKHRLKGKEYVIMASARDTSSINYLQNHRNRLIIVYLIFLTLLGLTGWIFSNRILKPISTVMNQVDEISGSNLSLRLSENNKKDEIARLSKTFNLMLERIEKAFKIQKTFASNAAHEIGNPLASITTQIEVALLSKKSNEEYENILISLLEDLKKLNEISTQLLLLTKIMDHNKNETFEKIRIDDLIWDARLFYLSTNRKANIRVQILNLPEDDANLFVDVNHTLIKTCFNNLIDNAVKYSEDQTVDIILSIEKKSSVVSFINKGKNISSEDLPFLFEPFYRSRNNLSVKGFGIGLSLVKQICDFHGIRIHVSSDREGKTSFNLVFKI